jgi:putative ABC transport system permease protein
MKILLKMAWRNIWRYKRRTFLTLAAIAFAVAISVFMRGLQKGTYEQMIENVISINTGYLQIHKKGFWDDRTLTYAFKPDSGLWEILSSQPHITSFAPRAESTVWPAQERTPMGCLSSA